jgi:nucleoside-diphosphate-sugar epimerase
MSTALIGSTGFVGTVLRSQTDFDAHFTSSNIGQLADAAYDLVVCAGAPAAKWKANAEPDADRDNLGLLTDALIATEAARVVLVSTIDVYPTPHGVDERTEIDHAAAQPYGRHRRELELACLGAFDDVTVVRLPALFGPGLRKNFVYDLLHQPDERFTHHASSFQFYDMHRLWADLETAAAGPHRVVNVVTEPLSAARVAREAFDVEYDHETPAPPVHYDVRTVHAEVFGRPDSPYIADAEEVLDGLRRYVAAERQEVGR